MQTLPCSQLAILNPPRPLWPQLSRFGVTQLRAARGAGNEEDLFHIPAPLVPETPAAGAASDAANGAVDPSDINWPFTLDTDDDDLGLGSPGREFALPLPPVQQMCELAAAGGLTPHTRSHLKKLSLVAALKAKSGKFRDTFVGEAMVWSRVARYHASKINAKLELLGTKVAKVCAKKVVKSGRRGRAQRAMLRKSKLGRGLLRLVGKLEEEAEEERRTQGHVMCTRREPKMGAFRYSFHEGASYNPYVTLLDEMELPGLLTTRHMANRTSNSTVVRHIAALQDARRRIRAHARHVRAQRILRNRQRLDKLRATTRALAQGVNSTVASVSGVVKAAVPPMLNLTMLMRSRAISPDHHHIYGTNPLFVSVPGVIREDSTVSTHLEMGSSGWAFVGPSHNYVPNRRVFGSRRPRVTQNSELSSVGDAADGRMYGSNGGMMPASTILTHQDSRLSLSEGGISMYGLGPAAVGAGAHGMVHNMWAQTSAINPMFQVGGLVAWLVGWLVGVQHPDSFHRPPSLMHNTRPNTHPPYPHSSAPPTPCTPGPQMGAPDFPVPPTPVEGRSAGGAVGKGRALVASAALSPSTGHNSAAASPGDEATATEDAPKDFTVSSPLPTHLSLVSLMDREAEGGGAGTGGPSENPEGLTAQAGVRAREVLPTALPQMMGLVAAPGSTPGTSEGAARHRQQQHTSGGGVSTGNTSAGGGSAGHASWGDTSSGNTSSGGTSSGFTSLGGMSTGAHTSFGGASAANNASAGGAPEGAAAMAAPHTVPIKPTWTPDTTYVFKTAVARERQLQQVLASLTSNRAPNPSAATQAAAGAAPDAKYITPREGSQLMHGQVSTPVLLSPSEGSGATVTPATTGRAAGDGAEAVSSIAGGTGGGETLAARVAKTLRGLKGRLDVHRVSPRDTTTPKQGGQAPPGTPLADLVAAAVAAPGRTGVAGGSMRASQAVPPVRAGDGDGSSPLEQADDNLDQLSPRSRRGTAHNLPASTHVPVKSVRDCVVGVGAGDAPQAAARDAARAARRLLAKRQRGVNESLPGDQLEPFAVDYSHEEVRSEGVQGGMLCCVSNMTVWPTLSRGQ